MGPEVTNPLGVFDPRTLGGIEEDITLLVFFASGGESGF